MGHEDVGLSEANFMTGGSSGPAPGPGFFAQPDFFAYSPDVGDLQPYDAYAEGSSGDLQTQADGSSVDSDEEAPSPALSPAAASALKDGGADSVTMTAAVVRTAPPGNVVQGPPPGGPSAQDGRGGPENLAAEAQQQLAYTFLASDGGDSAGAGPALEPLLPPMTST